LALFAEVFDDGLLDSGSDIIAPQTLYNSYSLKSIDPY